MATFTIRGQKVRSASQRRFVVVACRPETFEGQRWDPYAERIRGGIPSSGDYVPETYHAFTEIVGRSDSVEVARKRAAKYGGVAGGWIVVIDTATGEEI